MNSDYVVDAVKLLCSPRLVRAGSLDPQEWVTKRGILMGEPGTKVMLTFLNVLIFVHVDDIIPNASLARTAGDDYVNRLKPIKVEV
jgi:hypothetical protein